jgi:hypothetical protein
LLRNKLKLRQILCRRGGIFMPKDSQPDNKESRMEKCNGQTPITRENQNKNKNAKHKSIKNNDV